MSRRWLGEAELLAAIITDCDEFEAHGWRRTRAVLQRQGIWAGHKRIKRFMGEDGFSREGGGAMWQRPTVLMIWYS